LNRQLSKSGFARQVAYSASCAAQGCTKDSCMDFALYLQTKEGDLIKACIRKERWAQQLLYEEYYSSMMGVCLRYANNEEDALDILHEGFIKVFKHIARYQPGTSLNSWIRRIMVNTSIDYYRKSIRRRTEDLETAYELSAQDADAVSQCSEHQILEAVQQLSPAYRTVFNLYVIEGYSHKEIADMLAITESTSRSNLVKARLKLKEILMSRLYGYEEQ
jgi:RNA polymerase sigma factor (sigma-70 family)